VGSQNAYALLGLTAIVAGLVGLLTFAVLRFLSAMRDMGGQLRESRSDRVFMASALEEAVGKLKAQERAMAERAEASERLSAEIVSGLMAGLIVVGLDREVRMLNAAGRRLLDVPPGGVSEPLDLLLRRARPLASLIDECLATARPIVRRSIEMPDGSSPATHLGVTVSPLFDGAGGLHGAIGLFTDLTSIVALEEQLRLKDSLARLGELTAGLAHEFRNGLATVHGYARLIDPARLPAEYRPYMEGIRQETASLEEVVSKFLNFAGPTPITMAPVDLRAVAARAAEEFRAAARESGGQIAIRGEFRRIEGDEVLLRQALNNVLQNALQACAAAGVPPAIVIEGQVDAVRCTARLVVSDNGPGIEPALRERVFQPFFTSKGHGTGLGLAVVQKIIVSHGGRVTAGAVASGGAAIQIELPLPSLSA
jgi:signal transduction histidine kinase